MINQEGQQINSNPEYDKWLEEVDKEREPFNFIKIEFLVDMREAEKRYKEEYKNDVGGTRSGQLSFNQWLECKKFEASKFYMKHSDIYLI